MKILFSHLILIVGLGSFSCTTTRNTSAAPKDNHKIDIIFVQVNDVYEIAPLEAGKFGGMARVATLKKQYLTSNPNTFLVMAGDFLSPSVYNSLQYQGKRIRGQQMIEAMNAAGMNIAIFGNHEFDITESELQSRLNESNFKWVSSNTFHKSGNDILSFVKSTSSGNESLPETYIMTVKDGDGTTAKIGFIGLTIPFNKAGYVSYTDVFTAAETSCNRIKDSCDAIVAITHQLVQDDIILAKKIPALAMILGGHEHNMRFEKVGKIYITKAHANAKSAYIVKLTINKKRHSIKVKPELKMIDESVAIDSATDVVVKKWRQIADNNYASLGFDAKKVVMESGEPLDGRESEIRTHPTNLSNIIVAAMQQAVPTADVVIINSGSVRVDDIVQMPVTQYDIIRTLPFGGGIMEVDMKGSLLIKTLEAGRKNIGIGGFLHHSSGVIYNDVTKVWFLKNAPIDQKKIYKVAITDFLMTGGEANMSFLTKDNPDVVKVYPAVTDISPARLSHSRPYRHGRAGGDSRSDIRLAIIRYMEKLK
ncbi:MAG: bifunctional metallophosphatase/5'-nucleotidase [Bacteroidota bacterium]|nr:bifunctional metallophosphatase/5'-nucleotidase [Bacteroidota bacterium]